MPACGRTASAPAEALDYGRIRKSYTSEQGDMEAATWVDYAPDPWRTVKLVIGKVLAGKYEHFFPPASGTPARPTEH